jgi:hypothetical protein
MRFWRMLIASLDEEAQEDLRANKNFGTYKGAIYENVVEFDHFRMQAGLPNFVLCVSEWLDKTNAIGLIFHHSII